MDSMWRKDESLIGRKISSSSSSYFGLMTDWGLTADWG